MAVSAYRPYAVRVAAREELSPHFARVTFTADDLAHLGWDGPDQRIKLLFPVPGEEVPAMRTYTTRYADPANRRLVVDFVCHGDTGPATRWVNRAQAGDELVVIAPDATLADDAGGHEWHPGEATTLLLAADESAVPAAAAILESLDPGARGAVFLEVPAAADVLSLPAPAGIEVTWLARDTRPGAAHGELLGAAVRAWADEHVAASAPQPLEEPDGPAGVGDDILWEVPEAPAAPGLYAWLAGEAGAITGLRRHLVSGLGIDRRRVAFMGYWRIGRAEAN